MVFIMRSYIIRCVEILCDDVNSELIRTGTNCQRGGFEFVELVVIVFFENFARYAKEVVWGSYRVPKHYKYDINIINLLLSACMCGLFCADGCISL